MAASPGLLQFRALVLADEQIQARLEPYGRLEEPHAAPRRMVGEC